MEQPSRAWVVGAINPLGRGASLLVPVLSDRPGGNAHFVQTLDGHGRVNGFQPAELDAIDRRLRDDGLSVTLGDDALWGLAFPAGDTVVGPTRQLAELLRARENEFEDQTLALLSMARVLWGHGAALTALGSAWRRLDALNPSGAQTWRRTVAVPAAIRAEIELLLRHNGGDVSPRELAAVELNLDHERPMLLIPDELFLRVADLQLLHRVADEALAVAKAVDLPEPSLHRLSTVLSDGKRSGPPPSDYPATVWGIGKQGAELARLMTRPGSRALSDEDPGVEGRFGEPAFPADIPNVQVVPHSDPEKLAGRIAPIMAGRRFAADSPVERYAIIVFGPEPQAAEAAELLALYLQTEGVPAVGVLLEPPGGQHQFSDEILGGPMPKFPLLFLMSELGRLPGGGAPGVARLVMLLRQMGPPSDMLDALVGGPSNGHARFASVVLRPGDDPSRAAGRGLARLRSAESHWPKKARIIALVEYPEGSDGEASPYAAAVGAALSERPSVDDCLCMGAFGDPRLTVVALDLEWRRGSPEAFERVCRAIFEDLGCPVAVEGDSQFDFVVGAPGFTILVEARRFDHAIPADILRAISSRSDGGGKRLLLTSAVAATASAYAEADGVEVVDYRDIDRIEDILLEEYGNAFKRLRAARPAAPEALLAAYSDYVLAQCAASFGGARPEPAYAEIRKISWKGDGRRARIDGQYTYDHPDEKVLFVWFEVTAEGPGPVHMSRARYA